MLEQSAGVLEIMLKDRKDVYVVHGMQGFAAIDQVR